jgi:hypothetical protein
MTPALNVTLYLYEKKDGGIKSCMNPDGDPWGCATFVRKADLDLHGPSYGWRCYISIGGTTFMEPGETRDATLSFLSEEGLEAALSAGRVYLYGGRFFGEATVKL